MRPSLTGLSTTKPTNFLYNNCDLSKLRNLRCNHPLQEQTSSDGTKYMAPHTSVVQKWKVNDKGSYERASKSQGEYTPELSNIIAEAFHSRQKGAPWLMAELGEEDLP